MTTETLSHEQLSASDRLAKEINTIGEKVSIEDRFPVEVQRSVLRYKGPDGQQYDRILTIRCGEGAAKKLQSEGVRPNDVESDKFVVQVSNGDYTNNHVVDSVSALNDDGKWVSESRFGAHWQLKSRQLELAWYHKEEGQPNKRFALTINPIVEPKVMGELQELVFSYDDEGRSYVHEASKGVLCNGIRTPLTPQLDSLAREHAFAAKVETIGNRPFDAVASMAVSKALDSAGMK